jgi:thiosulfate/3-mercaptopyruvate sulfurtransferase
MARKKFIIETEELEKIIDENPSNLKIIDASLLPLDQLVFKQHRIHRALKLDMLDITHNKKKPHFILPTEDKFKTLMMKKKIARTDQIVVYDQFWPSFYTAPLVAWILRFFGAENVRVLEGGISKWISE